MKKNVLISLWFITIVFSVCFFLFYWFQIRPAQIKHDCSWVKMHTDAKPGKPAITKEQLIAKGIIRSCQKEIDALKKVDPSASYSLGDMSVHAIFSPQSQPTNGQLFRGSFDDPLWQATSCIEDGNQVIAAYKKPIEAVPAKDWYEKATKEQYDFCIHDKGL